MLRRILQGKHGYQLRVHHDFGRDAVRKNTRKPGSLRFYGDQTESFVSRREDKAIHDAEHKLRDAERVRNEGYVRLETQAADLTDDIRS